MLTFATSQVIEHRTVTYAHIVIDHCPQKEDPNHKRIAVRGNLIDYPFELTTRTADMVSSKILWNSVISTKDACFAGANIKNMYLKTTLNQFQYMKIWIALLPDNIIEHCQLQDVFFSWVTPPLSHTYHTHNLQHT